MVLASISAPIQRTVYTSRVSELSLFVFIAFDLVPDVAPI
jgi:hypothetical protein